MTELPLHNRHAGLGARFGEFAGWQMPLWYAGALAEHMAVRQTAGVFDISHMGRFQVCGEAGASTLASFLTRDPAKLATGASSYCLSLNESGGIIDDLIVYRLNERSFRVICNAANMANIFPLALDATRGRAALVRDELADSVLLAVQGPDARGQIAQAISEDVMAIRRHGCAEVVSAGERFFCARGGYTGEDGFEVMTSPTAGERLLDRLIEAGCVPCGLAARDSLRLEAAMPLHGSDIDQTTSPWEAGLGWAIELDHEFTGRSAVEASRNAVSRRLTCLVSDSRGGVFRHGQPVLHRDQKVGHLSSGGFSPMLDRSVGMAYLPKALSSPGQELQVDLRGRMVTARTVKRPFYKSPEPVRVGGVYGQSKR